MAAPRRALASLLLAALLVVVLPTPADAEEGGCSLKPWLAETPAAGEEGYHVLCMLDKNTAHVYQGGVLTESPKVVSISSGTFRSGLSDLLKIKDKITYDVQGKQMVWDKQPWSVFTAKGSELPPGKEEQFIIKDLEKRGKPILLLLFEGGAWRWPTMAVGYVRRVMPGIALRTVSRQPGLFEVHIDADKVLGGVGDELSIQLLSDVVELAKPRLEPSSTEGKVNKAMRSSEQTFLNYEDDPKLIKLRAGTAKLLRAPEESLEHLQVVRYGKTQHYDAHRDYWDPREFPDVPRFTGPDGFWNQRHATLLWYLAAPEAGGETWFPRAHGGPIPYGEWMACDERGAKVSPSNATAVLFYSLRADGDIDEYSWHSGCSVQAGVKWAANSWMHNGPIVPRRRRKEL